MVMSKAVVDAKVSSEPIMIEAIKQDRWHLKSGKWNAVGIRVKNSIMEYLDEVAMDVVYSDIRNYLLQNLPDDCIEYTNDKSKSIKWQISNTDIKGLVAGLVAEGKVVDL